MCFEKNFLGNKKWEIFFWNFNFFVRYLYEIVQKQNFCFTFQAIKML